MCCRINSDTIQNIWKYMMGKLTCNNNNNIKHPIENDKFSGKNISPHPKTANSSRSFCLIYAICKLHCSPWKSRSIYQALGIDNGDTNLITRSLMASRHQKVSNMMLRKAQNKKCLSKKHSWIAIALSWCVNQAILCPILVGLCTDRLSKSLNVAAQSPMQSSRTRNINCLVLKIET